jgi:hypothetical protein
MAKKTPPLRDITAPARQLGAPCITTRSPQTSLDFIGSDRLLVSEEGDAHYGYLARRALWGLDGQRLPDLDVDLLPALPPAPTRVDTLRLADGALLRIAAYNVELRDKAGVLVWTTGFSASARRLAESPDGARLAIGFCERVVILDRATGQRPFEQGPENHIDRLLFDADQRHLLGVVADHYHKNGRHVHRWSLPDGAWRDTSDVRHLSDGQLFGALGEHLVRLDPETLAPTPLHKITLTGPIATDRAGQRALAFGEGQGGKGGGLHALRLEADGTWSDRQVSKHSHPSNPLLRMVAAPTGELAVQLAGDGKAVIWSMDGELLHTLGGLGPGLLAAAWSPDASRLYTLGGAKLICWDVASGAQVWLAKPKAKKRTVVLSCAPGGRLLATYCDVTHKIMLHSAADGEAVAQLEAPCGGYVSALAFGADGILYVAGQDTALYALDLSAEL